MATALEWARGYALQGQADFRAWQAVEGSEDVFPCHRMLFLQMACEKLCKARLIEAGTAPGDLQTSHGYIANPLPLIIRAQLEFMGDDLRTMQGLLRYTRHIAIEVEVANPAVDRGGRRPDNCEYPWEDSKQRLHSPLQWTFTALQLLRDRFGPTFVKVLELAIDRAVNDLR